jgi:alginate O-acetyltransferase complex protein AlgI
MVFSSVTFLFYFLPVFLLLYFQTRWRNYILLAGSLFFYAWGEVGYVFVLLLSLCVNYVFGLLISKPRIFSSRLFLGTGIALNVLLLSYFKYAAYFYSLVNEVLARFGYLPFSYDAIHLPLGISFFTFQALSYLIDVYRKVVPAQRNPLTVAVYIAMFPQLVAGPIVRLPQIIDDLTRPRESLSKFSQGIKCFSIGLGQKVIIANTLAVPADFIFGLSAPDLNAYMAWLGAISYSVQIYFDFAGYSNMAIGLGLMLGIKLPENFNYPYISMSITEFWRRWHMTLSSWFRDYLYIPLGGNRKGAVRTYVNLITVFFLCGFWHGANHTFIVWGLYHGMFLIIERLGLSSILNRTWKPLRHSYALVVLIIGWVFFRAENLRHATAFLKTMVGLGSEQGVHYSISQFFPADVSIVLIAGIIGSTPFLPVINRLLSIHLIPPHPVRGEAGFFVLYSMRILALLLIMAVVSMNLAGGSYNPFIYFRF